MLDIETKTKTIYRHEINYAGSGSLYTNELCQEWHDLFQKKIEETAKWFDVTFEGQGASWETDYVAIFESENKENVMLLKVFDTNPEMFPELLKHLTPIKEAMFKASDKDIDGYIREYEYV